MFIRFFQKYFVRLEIQIGFSVLVSLLILVTGSLQIVNAKSQIPPGHEKIGPGVLRTIQKEGESQVVIALKTTPAMAAAKRNIPILKNEVAKVQSRVLASLTRSEYKGKHRYETVSGLAGTLRSETALYKIASNPNVIKIDLDIGGTGTLGTSVPLIGADARHTQGNSGEGVVVAFLDSGLDTDHPDLVDDLDYEACFGDDDGSIDGNGFCPDGSDRQTGTGAAEDDAGHGSHTTGIVTSGGVVGSDGVAPDASIVAIKVLDNCSFAGCFYAFSEIVAALDYINANNATLGVDVINMSIGTSATFAGDCDTSTSWNILGAASINTLRANGVVAFASSGNNGSGSNMTSPACLSNVVSVGAVDNVDVVAGFTNSNTSTDIMAPGVSIQSMAIGGGTVTASGTSMASPHAAGCAALLIESGNATTPAQIETRLETSTVQVTDAKNSLTFPRIDCGVDNIPPIADAGGPYPVNEGLSVTFDGSGSSDPDGTIALFEWDLDNDGSYDSSHVSPIGPTVIYFGGPDSQTIVLRVTDSFGDDDTDTTTVEVSNVPPTVNIPLVVPVPSEEGQAIVASATFSDPAADDSPFTCSVDYDDGSGLQPAIVSGNTCTGSPHIYAEDGMYTIQVTVTDKDGGSGNNTVTHQVNNVPPEVIIDINFQTVQYSNEILGVTISATDVLNDPMIISNEWDVNGGGFTSGLPDTLTRTSIGCNTIGVYDTCIWTISGKMDVPEGVYTVRSSVSDDDGGISVRDFMITVKTEDPTVIFPIIMK